MQVAPIGPLTSDSVTGGLGAVGAFWVAGGFLIGGFFLGFCLGV